MNRPPKRAIHGWINLVKPYDITSAQAVGAVKRCLRPKKIGHAGTLDPLATGVLPLALGEATKTVQYMMDAVKTYHFTIRFGAQTSTDDVEGDIIASTDIIPSDKAIAAVLSQFTGVISQLPPAYSAIKLRGERACDKMRRGEEVTLTPRRVEVRELSVMRRDSSNEIMCRAVCGKGTYIRSLARDIARAAGSLGYVTQLHRAQVGCFYDTDAISLDELQQSAIKTADATECASWLQPVECVLDDIPALTLDSAQMQLLRYGQACIIRHDGSDGMYQAHYDNKLVAIATRAGDSLSPLRGFNY